MMRDMQWRDAVRREMRKRDLGRSRAHDLRKWIDARRRRRRGDHAESLWLAVLGGAAVSAGLMYLLDPDRGAQRRSWTRDRLVRWRHQITDTAEATSRDVAHRARGVVARTRTWFRHEEVADDTLVERVRAEMGRKVSHPRAITVEARDGVVVLGGPVFAEEVERLLHAVERVRGVREVENQLEVHATASNVPALQGAEPLGSSAGFWRRSWPPATRLFVGTGGAALILAGLPRRTAGGYWTGLAGAALLLRAMTNSPGWITPIRGNPSGGGGQADGNGSPRARRDDERSTQASASGADERAAAPAGGRGDAESPFG